MDDQLPKSTEKSVENPKRVVRGRVNYADGQPASDLQVHVLEVALRKMECCGKGRSSTTGNYEIEYPERDSSSAESGKTGVIVEVYGSGEKPLARSAIQYGVASTRTIDLVLPESERGPSEYERYLASLSPFLNGEPLAQFSGGEKDQDLTYLSGASGVPRERLELLVATEKMASGKKYATEKKTNGKGNESTGAAEQDSSSQRGEAIPFTAAMFYAWMRQGLLSEREKLLDAQPATLTNALKKAGDDNLIPALSAKDVEAIHAVLVADHTERVLQPAPKGLPASLGDSLDLMTGASALSPNQKRFIAELTADQAIGSATDDKLKAEKLTPTQVGSLRQIAALHQLSGGDHAMLKAAHRHLIGKSNATSSLPLHGIADLDESEWRDILKTAKPELTDPVEVENNARSLVERTAELFPNAFLVSRGMRQPDGTQLKADLSEVAKLQRHNKDHGFKTRFDELKLDGIAAGHQRSIRASFDRMTQLVNRYPGLELDAVLAEKGTIATKVSEIQKRVSLLGTFVTANPDTDFLALDYVPDSADLKELKFTGLQNVEKTMVLRTVKAHQRAYRIAGGALKAQRLMEAGFHSGNAIAKVTLEKFLGSTGLSVAEAAPIYAKAVDMSLDTGIQFMAMYNLLQPFGVGNSYPFYSFVQPPQIVNHLKRFDGFKELFGAQTICRCQHCRSVLGPAAYFVDLMRFIHKNITELVFDNNPQADATLKLQYRRPDLWTLPLTCENSNTLVPTLDIVNEVLENFIDGNRTPTADQRRAIQRAAYLKLAQAKDSFAQPYVLPLRQVETYLGHFQLTRPQIAQVLGLDTSTTARAWLGVSLVEWDLIVNPGTSAQLDKLFLPAITSGTSADTQLFLALSNWTRDELGQLFNTQFVQGGTPITIEASKASTTSVQNDREFVKGYSFSALERLHRFTRLWRAIRGAEPWSIPELDLVVSSLAQPGVASTLTSSTLVDLVKLLEVQNRFAISVEQLCALVIDIPRTSLGMQRSLFDRLFNLESFVVQDGVWPPAAPPVYRHPSSLASNTAATTVLANSKLNQRLMAGLQVSDQELVQLLEEFQWLTAGVRLDIGNLTLLYRHALLARTLKLSIPELFKFMVFGQVSNARVSGLADLLQLTKVVADWRETGLVIDDMAVITGGRAQDPNPYPDPKVIADSVAEQIRSGHLLEFSATALSQVQGITAEQSKAVILQNAAVFQQVVPEGEAYRLQPAADPNAANFVLAGVASAGIPAMTNLLKEYHVRAMLEKLLAAQFKLSEGALHQLSVMCGNVLTTHDANLTQEMYSNGPVTILQGIVAKLAPLVVLFRNKVWDESNLSFVASNPGVFDMTTPLFAGANPAPISFNTVLKVSFYARLVGVRDQGFTSQEEPPDAVAVQTVLSQGFGQDATVAKALRVLPSRLGRVKAYLSLNNAKPFEGLHNLAQALSITELLGLSGAALPLLVPTTTNATAEYNELTEATDALIAVLRSKYPDEQRFAQTIEPYEDILRSRKRDGLVEYVIRSMKGGFTTASDLYQFFLIDTQVEGCARTARLVAAHGSLQLYVHRVLMNLERSGPDGPNEFSVFKVLANLPSGPLDRIQSEWEWRRTYRVWEANRKVFLYPESYLEPELRDDKTSLFHELESTLLQERINEENATNGYTQYLEGYEEVVSLKIAGALHDINEDAKEDRLHLFGATADDPPVFYYRTIDNIRFTYEGKRKSYTQWRKLNVQIPVREVSPVIVDGRLLIFWVQITTTPANKLEKGESRFVGYHHKFIFNYSEKRADGTWTAPQKLPAFDAGGLPFERLDDPLEEPTTVNLDSEIPAGQVVAAITTATNSGETSFTVLPVMSPENPTQLKIVSVPVVGGQPGQTQPVPVFRLIRLGPHPQNGYTPRYENSGTKHFEPVDGYTLRTPAWTRIHAEVHGNQLFLAGMDTNSLQSVFRERKPLVGLVDLFERKVKANTSLGPSRVRSRLGIYDQAVYRLETSIADKTILFTSTMELLGSSTEFPFNVGDWNRVATFSEDVNAVAVGKMFLDRQAEAGPDAIVHFQNDLVMFQLLGGLISPAKGDSPAQALTGTSLERIGTTIRREFRRELFRSGLGGLLSLKFQNDLVEQDPPISSPSPSMVIASDLKTLNFAGPFGVYFQEIFSHIPFLIANHLNSQQRFSAAQRWYHYLFDPTSSDMGPRRVWRCRQLVEEIGDVKAFRDALTDSGALEAYRRDPFNPHAIARLRPGSYHKTIVMKYIDNLLDWGDTLFAEFTMESLNEATMLYVLAADILGPRTAEIGDCGEASARPLTFTDVSSSLNDTSDFLIELEHYSPPPYVKPAKQEGELSEIAMIAGIRGMSETTRKAMTVATTTGGVDEKGLSRSGGLLDFGGLNNRSHSSWRSAGGTDLRTVPSYGIGQSPAREQPVLRGVGDPRGGARSFVEGDPIGPPEDDRPIPNPGDDFPIGSNRPMPDPERLIPEYRIPAKGIDGKLFGGKKIPPIEMVQDNALPQPLFCIPPNKDLMAYWDRVDDRLNKIRNCMDITGAKRRPSLYAPERDPRQLVKDKADGLLLDDGLNVGTGGVPPYRFSFMIEKAKQFASTVQSFGGMLLSAIEKKDAEQLARLRTTQEQHILKLRTRVQELEIESSEDTLTGLERQRETVELRQSFYETVLETGLIPWERTQQASRHLVTGLHETEATVQLVRAVLSLLPQLGAPTAMKYGGMETSGAAAGFASASQALAQAAEGISASAGLEATFQRRDEDWRQQKKLADKELENIKKQIEAAKARVAISRRSLEVHNKSIEQSEEVFQYYREKFTNQGLFTLLSTQLQRAHRDAYNAAFAVAKMAEQAYRFEHEYDVTTAMSNSYWIQDQAGLQAGEKLLLDLQTLERRFIETNYRTLEIEQSFSLMQVAPSALVSLQETGTCKFTIPESHFDLMYPGHYRRRIKAVRLTIPCIVGPFVSVGATLRMEKSKIRDNANAQQPHRECTLRHSTVVAASTAQNDSGTFEFNFRDERYMPFEGLGAVDTEWVLSLPDKFRSFDYRTISDVVLRINYTAEEDGTLRQQVDSLNGSLRTFMQNTGVSRIYSLRHEFPDVWNQLVRKPLSTAVDLELTNRHVPYFVSNFLSSQNPNQELRVSTVVVLLQTKGAVATLPQLRFNTSLITAFPVDPDTGLPGGAVSNVQIVRKHSITAVDAGSLAPPAGQAGNQGAFDESKLDDILLRVTFKLP